MFKLNKRFQPITFNDSVVDNVLITPETKIHVLPHSEKNQSIYDTFYQQLGLFLKKLPNNAVKKSVENLYNKKLIFIGFTLSKSQAKEISTRILLDKSSNKLNGIVLNSINLDINITTGETNNIDNCIYAIYFGVLRTALVISQNIKSNDDLHKLLTTYMYLVFTKTIGKNIFATQRQKDFLRLSCIYIYYIYFFNEKHTYAVSLLKRKYSDVVDKEIFEDFIKKINENKGYTNIKDIPKLLIDLKIVFVDPKQIYMSMIRSLKPIGFYTFIGPYDQFIASMILCKYPTDLFSRQNLTNQKIHDAVEKLVEKYVTKIRYELNGLPTK